MSSKEHSESAPCFSGAQSREPGRTSAHASRVCRHTCAHHAEVMDPCLWSALPEHLLAHIFARLPMPQIFCIGSLSKSWSATSKTEAFKRICAEAHSKTFGILGFRKKTGPFRLAAFDLENSKWIYHEPKQLPREYQKCARYKLGSATEVAKHGALYGHDGGLVCFVPTKNRLPILVGNPLANDWKTLPRINLQQKYTVVMVQLVTDPETGAYRVMLVCRYGGVRVPENVEGASPAAASISDSAVAYDSRTGIWSSMTSGYVYGDDHTYYGIPKVFDCSSKALHSLSNQYHFAGSLISTLLVKDHLFVMHANRSDTESDSVYEVTELASREDTPMPGILRILNRVKSTLRSYQSRFVVLLFVCNGFILLVADNGEENFGEFHHQLVRLYDTCRQEWHTLPVLNEVYIVEKVENHFMCELRWDACP